MLDISAPTHVFAETSGPGNSKANGAAKAAVKVAKNTMEKCHDANEDHYLGLLNLRNTPQEGLTSPAQRLMGRRTKHIVPTMFNLLKPAAMEHRIRETTHGEQETLYKWETHSECNPSTTPVNGKRPPTPRDSNPEPVT